MLSPPPAPSDHPAVGAPAVALPDGFVAYTGHAGLRAAGDDVTIVASTQPCASAGVFTQSSFAGPSVVLSRARAGRARAMVVVATNANVATGPQGRADAEEVAALAARAAGVPVEEMLIASTGVIGRPYPMPLLRSHLQRVQAGGFTAGAGEVARAMMTTDTVPKVADRRVGAARVVGVAKGVGMIEPEMATMLALVCTDAEAEPGWLGGAWRRAVGDTFNCLSVDGDTSTSDSAVVLANGAAGPVPPAELAAALREVCLDLTLQLARDGEGATKLLTVTVAGARDGAQAHRVAKAVVNSPLVKTAVHGGDPNWGRVAMAVGKCREDGLDPDRVVIGFAGVQCYPGPSDEATLAEVRDRMGKDHVHIDIDLAQGSAEATVYGCDLSADYVRINADYTT